MSIAYSYLFSSQDPGQYLGTTPLIGGWNGYVSGCEGEDNRESVEIRNQFPDEPNGMCRLLLFDD